MHACVRACLAWLGVALCCHEVTTCIGNDRTKGSAWVSDRCACALTCAWGLRGLGEAFRRKRVGQLVGRSHAIYIWWLAVLVDVYLLLDNRPRDLP
jgi:hypothetical protein